MLYRGAELAPFFFVGWVASEAGFCDLICRNYICIIARNIPI